MSKLDRLARDGIRLTGTCHFLRSGLINRANLSQYDASLWRIKDPICDQYRGCSHCKVDWLKDLERILSNE